MLVRAGIVVFGDDEWRSPTQPLSPAQPERQIPILAAADVRMVTPSALAFTRVFAAEMNNFEKFTRISASGHLLDYVEAIVPDDRCTKWRSVQD